MVEVAALVGMSQPTVRLWRDRYAAQGLRGLEDQPRSGRPPKVDDAAKRTVLAATLLPPEKLGVTHWSSRLLAAKVGLHFTQVAESGVSGASSRGSMTLSSSPLTPT